jgi:GT2 family glycosyltransferase
MGEMPAVSIVIVTFNSARHIRACLESILAHTRGVRTEVILVDNGSSDGTAAQAAAAFPAVTVISAEENLGFAVACNRGASFARGEYLLFLNPDTRLLSNAVEILLECERVGARVGRPAICGAALVDDRGLPVKSSGDFPLVR